MKIYFILNKDPEKSKYYTCPHCKYSTNKTSNFKYHLKAKHSEEFSLFLKSEINFNSESNNIDHNNSNQNNLSTTERNDKTRKKDILNDEAFGEPYKNRDKFFLLKNVFDNLNHLNKYDDDIGNFCIHTSKIINRGTFSTAYMGVDKRTGFKVIILKTDLKYRYNIDKEKYILNRMQGLGNFPPFYGDWYDKDFSYFIEGHMGFDVKKLFKLCDKSLDLFSVISIGIDLVENIEILHSNGFLHRDLKLDNISFGPLCIENIRFKNKVGILDFGNSKLLRKKDGKINFNKVNISCRGNKMFASTNALKNKDILPGDDLESIFYILIYLLNGSLPWEIGKNVEINNKSEVIIKIRESFPTCVLCQKFPLSFQKLFDEIKDGHKANNPEYQKIIKIFEAIKKDCKVNKLKEKLKYKWNEVFIDALRDDKNKINSSKKKQVNALFEQYGLKLNNYVDYIID